MPGGQARMDYRAAALTAGRYDLLVEEYVYPLTVYLPGRPPMSATPQTVWGFFQAFHAGLVAAGMTVLTARVAAEGLPQGGRAQVWTDWFGEGPGVTRRQVAQTVCYRRLDGTADRTELLEFTRLDLPMMAAA
ncbi:MAG: hypothetical protein ACT4OK_21995 [Gemmobacter sp.]